mmetsp:Transcript_27076/g.56038  ORF Transcript_27076/g.56038 Transcript_27076/m.56038 type:complete len:111 (-) Transcript_27076:60-392(-)
MIVLGQHIIQRTKSEDLSRSIAGADINGDLCPDKEKQTSNNRRRIFSIRSGNRTRAPRTLTMTLTLTLSLTSRSFIIPKRKPSFERTSMIYNHPSPHIMSAINQCQPVAD